MIQLWHFVLLLSLSLSPSIIELHPLPVFSFLALLFSHFFSLAVFLSN